MKLSNQPVKVLSLCVILIAITFGSAVGPGSVRAQSTPDADCGFDLSEATALMTKAQAHASGGDMSGAVALLDQVKQALDAIQARCGTGGGVALSSKYTEANGVFSISYPAGWISKLLSDTPTELAGGVSPVLFASDAGAYDMIANNKPSPKSQGVVIYLGNAEAMLKQLGVGSGEMPSPVNAKSLLDAIVSGQSSSDGVFGTPTQGAAIKDYATAEVPFSFIDSKTSASIADGTLLMVQLGKDQFAVLLSFAAPGKAKSAATLARSIAATLQVPAKAS